MGLRLRKLRRDSKKTQETVAGEAGMSRVWLSHMERTPGMPHLRHLEALAEALACDDAESLLDELETVLHGHRPRAPASYACTTK